MRHSHNRNTQSHAKGKHDGTSIEGAQKASTPPDRQHYCYYQCRAPSVSGWWSVDDVAAATHMHYSCGVLMMVAPSRYIPGSVCRHELRQKKNENGTEHILVQPLEICTANMRHTQKIEKKPTKFRAADTRQFHKSILIYYLQAQWLWCFCCSMVLRFVARLAFLRQMSAIRSNFLTDRRRSAQTITTTNNKKKKKHGKKMMMSDERNIIICLNGSSREWRIS